MHIFELVYFGFEVDNPHSLLFPIDIVNIIEVDDLENWLGFVGG